MSSTVDTTNFSRGVLSDALEGVGHTPLVQLSNLAKEEGLACNLSEFGCSLIVEGMGEWVKKKICLENRGDGDEKRAREFEGRKEQEGLASSLVFSPSFDALFALAPPSRGHYLGRIFYILTHSDPLSILWRSPRLEPSKLTLPSPLLLFLSSSSRQSRFPFHRRFN